MNAMVLYYMGRFEDALRSARLALDLDTRSCLACCMRALTMTALGKARQGLEEYHPTLATTSPFAVGHYVSVLSQTGRPAEAEEQRSILVEHQKTAHIPPSCIAVVCAGLGRADETFSWLNRAVEEP